MFSKKLKKSPVVEVIEPTKQNLKDLKKEFLNNFQNVFIEKPQASKTSSSEEASSVLANFLIS